MPQLAKYTADHRRRARHATTWETAADAKYWGSPGIRDSPEFQPIPPIAVNPPLSITRPTILSHPATLARPAAVATAALAATLLLVRPPATNALQSRPQKTCRPMGHIARRNGNYSVVCTRSVG